MKRSKLNRLNDENSNYYQDWSIFCKNLHDIGDTTAACLSLKLVHGPGYGWLFVSKVFFDTFNKNLIHSIKI